MAKLNICLICLWDSRAEKSHYTQNWPPTSDLDPGFYIVIALLVNPQNTLLPILHIKLGLFKNFVKAMGKDGEALAFIEKKFPKVSEAKVKAGVFDGPQIKELIKDDKLDENMNESEKKAWKYF